MRKKLIPLLAIAFAVALVSTAVFYSLFAARLSGAPGRPQTTVVAAARELPAGTTVARDDVRAVPWTGGQAPVGSFNKPEQVLGKVIVQPVAPGEPIMQSRVASKDGGGAGVPEGMRAVSIHVSDSSGVVALLKPGFKVDVQTFASRSQRAPKDEMRTLLRGVPVLSVSTQPEQSSQGYFSAPVVTLLAQAPDAEQLALADSFGRLRLSLRNPLEPAGVPATPVRAVSGPRFLVKTFAVTESGRSVLAARLHVDFAAADTGVIVPAHPQTLEDLLRAPPAMDWASTKPDAHVSAPARVEVAPGFTVHLSAGAGANRVRIRTETARVSDANRETHSVEATVAPGRAVMVWGPDRKIVLLVPEPRS